MQIGTPLSEVVGDRVEFAGPSGLGNVLAASGFEVSQQAQQPAKPAPTSGIAELVVTNNGPKTLTMG